MDRLCIYWEANGGKGFSSISADTPANKLSLESWADRLKQENKGGTFVVQPYPHGKTVSIPGTLVARLAQG